MPLDIELRAAPVERMDDVSSLVATSSAAWLEEGGGIEPDLARLARELKHGASRHVGLLPVGELVPLPEVARGLGQALALLTQRAVLLLDPERRALTRSSEHPTAALEGALVAPGVVAIAPRRVASPGEKFEALKQLARFADSEPELWSLALHDLVGCTLPGELLGALDVLDAVVLVGRLGHTTDAELRRATRALPPDATIGVLLVE